MTPLTLKLKSRRAGKLVREQVFIGPDADHLALAGILMFEVGEWQLFGAALLAGARQTHGQFVVVTEGDEAVVTTG